MRVARVLHGLPVAFEAEIEGGVFVFDVLDCAATLDGADGEAARVIETGDNSRLPFQRALNRLVEFSWLIEIDDVDVPVCGCDDKQVFVRVHAVDALLAVNGRDG